MTNKYLYSLALCCLLYLAAVPFAFAQQAPGSIAFTVSMEQPSTHYYHVTMRCEGIKKETLDLKLPVWTPGYYWIMNFSKNVVNFQVTNGAGNPLAWEKTTKNTWHVQSGNAPVIQISYDVYAFTQSVADPYLDEQYGYISPAAVFMHIAGQLQHPVTVKLKPYEQWHSISTGLEPVKEQQHTYRATDFDVLYDCPVYLGRQQVHSFEVKGIPHYVAVADSTHFANEKFIADLKRMVTAGVAIIGDIPYRHYTFMIMGEGRGGLEHRNSTAVFFGGPYKQMTQDAYKNWLCFLSHEFFHLYNIKCIRPVALGPFNYDQENYTNMLWVSEGFTVYYEYLVLNRAGLLTREDVFERIQQHIMSYENIPGHLFQSATASSFDTWIQFFNRSENASNTTISYYDKGCVLGMLLDLKIRHETKNKRSLDDVMRTLYREYYQQKKRGFTDHEFRQVCESIAGSNLQEVFDYAATVKAIDYAKYLSYAGLGIDITPKDTSRKHLGVTVAEQDFHIKPLAGADPLQSAIFKNWLKD